MRDVFVGYALIQYGAVMRWGRTIPSAEGAVLPQGESDPPLDYWLEQLALARTTDELLRIAERMRRELEAWRRRPDPPPPGETLDDLKHRLLTEGKGWTPQEVALAMRVTPTFVRNVRTEAERDPETGRADQRLSGALGMLAEGMSLRQVERITGIPRSTLHDARRTA
jgi:hypothetical protein